MSSEQSGADRKGPFVQVGKVKDAHGIKGELFITLFAGEAAWLEKLKEIRLVSAMEPRQSRIFSAKSVRLHKNGLIAKTNEIKDRNEAESLRGWFFEIPEEFLISEIGETIYLKEIEGFKVFTKEKGEVGRVTGFASNTAQDLLIVTTSWGEFEIPFVEAYIDTLDFDSGELHLDLPQGLLGELDGELGGEREGDEPQ